MSIEVAHQEGGGLTHPRLSVVRDNQPGTNLGKVEPSAMLPLYKNWLTVQGYAPTTVEQRVKFAAIYLRRFGTFDPPAHDVADWLMGYRGWTRGTYMSHLKSLYTFLLETGAVSSSPIEKMRRPSAPPPQPKPLSSTEMTTVLATANDRMKTWLLLGVLAGLRSHEIAKFSGKDIDERELYVCGKGGREAVLPTHPLLWERAQDYPRADYWFPSPQHHRDHVSPSLVGNEMRAHFRACGIGGRGAVHRLRYSFGTNLSRSGVGMRVVQELMRHSSLETTQRYIAVDDSERRAAIAGLVA